MMQSNIILERIRDGRVISRHEARNTLTSVFIGYAAGRIGGGMGVALAGDLTFRLLNSGGSLIKTLTGADALGSAINFTNSTVTEIAQDEEHTDTYTVASIQVWRDTVHISTVDAADWTPAVVESPSGETLRITYVLSLQYSGRVFATTNTRLQGGGQLTVDTVAVRRHMFGVLMGAPLFTPAASLLRTTQIDVYSRQQTAPGEDNEYALIDTQPADASAVIGADNLSYTFSVAAATEPSDGLRERIIIWRLATNSAVPGSGSVLASYDWGERPQGSAGETETLTLTLTLDEPA